jgi:NAD-reducing hydrogenase large subunit
VDRNGVIRKVKLLIATGQNNLAMNRTVAQIARHYVRGGTGDIPEPMLNRIEHGIRCHDPCLSCSTHAVGQMPLRVQRIAPDGKVVRELTRG